MAEPRYHFHNHRIGILLADGLAVPVRFILDGATGELAFPADGNTIGAEELVLFVPQEQPDHSNELQLLLTAREIDGERSGLRDRWSAYHGPPDRPLFCSCRMESAKFDGSVIEVAELFAINAIRGVEGKLLKRVNADKARLRSVCSRRAAISIPDPVAVGIDQFGIEVRATFGIVRLFFASTAIDAADAEVRLERLFGDAP